MLLLGDWAETTARGQGERFHKRPICRSWSRNGPEVRSRRPRREYYPPDLIARWLGMCGVAFQRYAMQPVNEAKVFLDVTCCSLGVRVTPRRSVEWLSGRRRNGKAR